jgi:hypothetical protein
MLVIFFLKELQHSLAYPCISQMNAFICHFQWLFIKTLKLKAKSWHFSLGWEQLAIQIQNHLKIQVHCILTMIMFTKWICEMSHKMQKCL